jgi:hypothetical protein
LSAAVALTAVAASSSSSRETGRWASLLPPASFTPFIACFDGWEERRAEDHTPSKFRTYRDGEHRLSHALISSLCSAVASVAERIKMPKRGMNWAFLKK